MNGLILSCSLPLGEISASPHTSCDSWHSFNSLLQCYSDQIRVGPEELIGSNLTIRGYSVPFHHGDTHNVTLKLCGSDIIQDNASLSFRWLQTIPAAIQISNDEVAIDDVQISIDSSTLQHDIVLLMDNFNNQTSIK